MQENPPPAPSFFTFFLYWLKLGFISFGGPAGQISMMHQELVEKRRWISQNRFLHALNFTMLLPGPEAQQLATYMGWLMFGVRGGIAAGVLFILPSLFILIALTWVYLNYGEVSAVSGVLYGIKPAVVAIVLFAAYRIGSKILSNSILKIIALLAFMAIFVLHIPFPYIVLGAGIIGFLGAYFLPNAFVSTLHHNNNNNNYGAAVIDDHSPIPSHARFNKIRLISITVVGIMLWLGMMSLLNHPVLLDIGVFFTKAALVTFGGAYAVLPYVYQGGVEQYQWLSATQMIDGLALGETTPGPLIMIVAFVGFVGAWSQAIFGAESLLLSGIAGATVATIVTFLPSFLFIFLGAPLIEATRNELKFSAPLSAITACVVGVILNLALFFAYHILLPDGLKGQLDLIASFMGIIAFIALFKYNISVVKVIMASALVGLLLNILA